MEVTIKMNFEREDPDEELTLEDKLDILAKCSGLSRYVVLCGINIEETSVSTDDEDMNKLKW